MPADASGAAGARTLAGLYLAKESKLDILVNNAGAAWGAEIEAFPENGWDKVMDLNVKAPFLLVQALLGALRAGASAERPAKVINIASIDGLSVNMQPTYSYSASKAGLNPGGRLLRPGRCLDEAPNASANPVLNRVEPIVEKQRVGGDTRLLHGILPHGVVSVPTRQRRNHLG